MTLGFWTLRRKMAVLLVLATVVPLAINAFVVSRRGRQLLEREAARQLNAAAEAVAARIDALHERYFNVVRELGHLPAIDETCGALRDGRDPGDEAIATMRAFRAGDEAIRVVALIDPTGRVRITTDHVFQDVDVTARAYFQVARSSDAPTVSLLVTSRLSQDVSLLAYAGMTGHGDSACVLVVAVRAEEFTERVRGFSENLGEGSFVVVTDELGVRIAHTRRQDFLYAPTGELSPDERERLVVEGRYGKRTPELLDSIRPAPELFARARGAQLGDRRQIYRVRTGVDASDNLMTARRLALIPWTAFVVVPARTVEAPVRELLATAIPITLAIVIGAFSAGLVVFHRMLRPVRALETATAQLAAGDHRARATITTRDELGVLGERFNAMAIAIERSTDELEHKVVERTRLLTDANHQVNLSREELIAQKEELQLQKQELSVQRDELQRKNLDVERADRMKSEFLANMSHELRTPLNSVIGFADLLGVTAEPRLEPDELSQLRDIHAAGKHLLLIINDILDLAKIEAGHVRLDLDAVAPDECVADAVTMVQALVRTKQIELRTAIRTKRAVRADAARLRQVMLNLLSNAVKFSPAGSAIDVRVTDADDLICFEVTDRGPGISAELANRLFQPFVQGEGALVKAHQGTGLGLAISKKLVELHGGTIEVDSRPGAGTTFRVRVPAAGRRSPISAAPWAATLLLVEGASERRSNRARLEAAGYRVERAGWRTDLAAAADAVDAALVVIDLREADQDATATLEQASRLSARRPVLLVSSEPEVLAPKPIDPEPLRALCRRLIAVDGRIPQVLVTDDDPRVAQLVVAALGAGYQVSAAYTATEGLRRARAQSFDLHIVDLSLPDGSGLDVLEALAADETTRSVPKIVLTAAQLDGVQLERLRQHAQAVAEKGTVTPDELLGMVDRLIRPTAPPVQPVGTPRPPTILVADDNDMNRELVRAILERLGYRIVQARDGAEALAIAERERPNLVLMDLAMPGVDGFTATRQLRAHPELCGVPVVALSAMAMKADEARARAAGVDDFLTKPVDRAALERTIERLLAT